MTTPTSPDERMTEALREHKQALADNPKMPHRELARREQELYALATSESRRSLGGGGMAEWMGQFVGEQHRLESRLRSAIYLRGDAASPIWDLVDGEERMPLRTGTRLIQHAKTITATSKYTLDEAVGIVVSEYVRGARMCMPDGRQARRTRDLERVVEETVREATGQQPALILKPTKRAHRRGAPTTSGNPRLGDSRTAFADVRKTMTLFVRDRLVSHGADAVGPTVLAAIREVDVELEAFFATIGRVLGRAENVIKGVAESTLSRRELIEAFRLLNLEPPKPKDKIDMKAVQRQKVRMAAAYHPDTHGGDRSMEPKFKAVIEAYETIKQYVDQQQH